jgi:hypothetical protein
MDGENERGRAADSTAHAGTLLTACIHTAVVNRPPALIRLLI